MRARRDYAVTLENLHFQSCNLIFSLATICLSRNIDLKVNLNTMSDIFLQPMSLLFI